MLDEKNTKVHCQVVWCWGGEEGRGKRWGVERKERAVWGGNGRQGVGLGRDGRGREIFTLLIGKERKGNWIVTWEYQVCGRRFLFRPLANECLIVVKTPRENFPFTLNWHWSKGNIDVDISIITKPSLYHVVNIPARRINDLVSFSLILYTPPCRSSYTCTLINILKQVSSDSVSPSVDPQSDIASADDSNYNQYACDWGEIFHLSSASLCIINRSWFS